MFATNGLCTHEKVHLADGSVIDDTVECPKHNGRFNYRSGAPLRAPVCVALATFPARITAGRIEIALSESFPPSPIFAPTKVAARRPCCAISRWTKPPPPKPPGSTLPPSRPNSSPTRANANLPPPFQHNRQGALGGGNPRRLPPLLSPDAARRGRRALLLLQSANRGIPDTRVYPHRRRCQPRAKPRHLHRRLSCRGQDRRSGDRPSRRMPQLSGRRHLRGRDRGRPCRSRHRHQLPLGNPPLVNGCGPGCDAQYLSEDILG